MTELHMIELRPALSALARFVHGQGLSDATRDEDLGYAVHAWLAAAFGALAPRPWRLLQDQRRPTRILGYTTTGAAELRRHLAEFADPMVAAVCANPDCDVASRPMPIWAKGRCLGFEVLCCPIGRKARSGVEKDVFLIRADSSGGDLDRQQVYCDWGREQLQRNMAATAYRIRLDGFRLVRQTRQTQLTTAMRNQRRLVRPQALLRGELEIGDPSAFHELLRRGLGRHRAFGYGMLLLRPPT